MKGKPLPKKEEDKKKQSKAPRAKASIRRNEAPPKPIKWAEMPSKSGAASDVHFREKRKQLMSSTFPNYFKASHCNPGVGPCIIKEVLFPPEAPSEIATFLESANVYHANASYELAINTYDTAQSKWRSLNNVSVLRSEFELFFLISIANVLESYGKDEFALCKYVQAKKEVKLSYNHPDQALPYCGIGSVLYHLEEYTFALRAYLKAREIRESYIGGDTVDTATVYNNLGCCMFSMNRIHESHAYFKLSGAIFNMQLGPLHHRTITASENSKKATRHLETTTPRFEALWYAPVFDPRAKKGGKGKKKRKKRR